MRLLNVKKYIDGQRETTVTSVTALLFIAAVILSVAATTYTLFRLKLITSPLELIPCAVILSWFYARFYIRAMGHQFPGTENNTMRLSILGWMAYCFVELAGYKEYEIFVLMCLFCICLVADFTTIRSNKQYFRLAILKNTYLVLFCRLCIPRLFLWFLVYQGLTEFVYFVENFKLLPPIAFGVIFSAAMISVGVLFWSDMLITIGIDDNLSEAQSKLKQSALLGIVFIVCGNLCMNTFISNTPVSVIWWLFLIASCAYILAKKICE